MVFHYKILEVLVGDSPIKSFNVAITMVPQGRDSSVSPLTSTNNSEVYAFHSNSFHNEYAQSPVLQCLPSYIYNNGMVSVTFNLWKIKKLDNWTIFIINWLMKDYNMAWLSIAHG